MEVVKLRLFVLLNTNDKDLIGLDKVKGGIK